VLGNAVVRVFREEKDRMTITPKLGVAAETYRSQLIEALNREVDAAESVRREEYRTSLSCTLDEPGYKIAKASRARKRGDWRQGLRLSSAIIVVSTKVVSEVVLAAQRSEQG
jgi:hypothetical protein